MTVAIQTLVKNTYEEVKISLVYKRDFLDKKNLFGRIYHNKAVDGLYKNTVNILN